MQRKGASLTVILILIRLTLFFLAITQADDQIFSYSINGTGSSELFDASQWKQNVNTASQDAAQSLGVGNFSLLGSPFCGSQPLPSIYSPFCNLNVQVSVPKLLAANVQNQNIQYLNQTFDLRGGFYSSFTLVLGAVGNNQGSGSYATGLSFVVFPPNAMMNKLVDSSAVGGARINSTSSAIGLVLDMTENTGHTLKAFRANNNPTLDIESNAVNAWFRLQDETIITIPFHLYYDASQYTLKVYNATGHLTFNVTSSVNQFNFAQYPSASVGFSGLQRVNQAFGGAFISDWSFRAFDLSATVVVACYGNYSLWINGIFQNSGNLNYYGDTYNIAVVPGTIISFNATPSSSLFGCFVETRFVNSTISVPVNTAGLWRCRNDGPSGWQTSNTSGWNPAVVYGRNDLQLEFQDENVAPGLGYRHAPNINTASERVWTASPNSAAFCSMTIPRSCKQSVYSLCINNERCNNSIGICYCPAPYFGSQCQYRGNPMIYSIYPTNGKNTGSTPIILSGANFTSLDRCLFNNISVVPMGVSNTSSVNTTMTCYSPGRQVQLETPINLVVRRVYDFDGTIVDSNPIIFTYTVDLFVLPKTYSVRASEPTNIPVYALNSTYPFPNVPMGCRFGINGQTSNATWISGTQVNCPTQFTTPQQVTLSITRNFVDYFDVGSVEFFENKSPFCSALPKDFSFINPTTIPAVTFLGDVGLYASVMSSQISPPPMNVSQVVDGDFCCQINANNQGKFCGISFGRSPADFVRVGLRKKGQVAMAAVNQIVTSWYNPCRNLPAMFSIVYDPDGTGTNWLPINTTATNNTVQCSTVSSDNGPTGLCVNFIENSPSQPYILGYGFGVQFSNQFPNVVNDSLPWIYEISVQGIFLDDMYQLKASLSQMQFAASETMEMGDLTLQVLGITGNSAEISSNFTVVPTLYLGDVDVTSQLNFFQNNLDISANISSPKIGKYRLVLESQIFVTQGDAKTYVQVLQPAVISNITIIGGPPQKIIVDPTLTVVADQFSYFSVLFCLTDSAGNLADFSGLSVSAAVFRDGALDSNFTQLLSNSCQNISFVIQAPSTTSKFYVSLSISNTAISNQIQVEILPGVPRKLVWWNFPTDNSTDNYSPFSSQPSFFVFDSVNNPVDQSTSLVKASVNGSLLTGSGPTLTNSVATIDQGQAVFQNLFLKGMNGETYTISFQVENSPILTWNVRIQNCSEVAFLENTVYRQGACICNSGYYLSSQDSTGNFTGNSTFNLKCLPCDVDEFKNSISDGDCTKCSSSSSTYNATGLSTCICNPGYLAINNGCENCPTGGICDRGVVVQIAAGYTVAPGESSIFYECHRDGAALSEISASLEACPVTSIDSPKCGDKYSGTRCLVCAEGYGHLGPYCEDCPSAAVNGVLIAVATIVILSILIFLVIQGRTAKNKEAVSTKILLNHIQMLALLSAVNAAWSNPFQTILLIGGVSTLINSGGLTSTDCAIRYSYYTQLSFFLIFPFASLLVTAIVHVIIYFFRAFILPVFSSRERLLKRPEIRKEIIASFVLSGAVITFITYPAVTYKIIDMFDCTIEFGGNFFLNVAPDVQCYTEDYSFYLIFTYIMLFLYCLGVPMLTLFLLYKYRGSKNRYIQIVLRFFYDGFKEKKFYWEIVIVLRKFLLVVALIIGRRNGGLAQIYGFLWIIQAALLMHITLRPYLSARQFRLELWSLLALLITLGVALFIPTLQQNVESSLSASYALSTIALVINGIVIFAFVFFIARGLLRRFARGCWDGISSRWNKKMPDGLKPSQPNLDKTKQFFKLVAESSDYDRDMLYASIEKWWNASTNYKRRRFMSVLSSVSKKTPFDDEFGNDGIEMIDAHVMDHDGKEEIEEEEEEVRNVEIDREEMSPQMRQFLEDDEADVEPVKGRVERDLWD
eukprot:TRINITY_DN2976_c2_g1_i1.p1 TRINITY_DN2976_c2_g1~~TRINITY_DN2976_c2_g1_i1.p1  ORF type:complete len:1897 (-),score=487.17 TRINITY_DN2976_c2_g1_i1:31-5721(-)